MSRIHRQSPTLLKFSEQGNLLGAFNRERHAAQEIPCPRCESKHHCRHPDGTLMSPLEVHEERMRAYL